MGSLFEIGKSGVQAYRQALSVTGQNIANVNTEGYNKRAADLEEVPSVQGGVTNVPDQSGLGVRVNQIRRSFDAFLASNLRDTNSEYERLDNFIDKLNKLENMLLPSDSDLGTFIGRFFNSLQDVASRPDELSARTVALENGKALANSFNSYDDQLKNFKATTNKEIEDGLKVVNSLIDQLAQVNKLIMSGGSKSSSPDILDARDTLLLDLSKYINFTTDYGQSGDAIVRLGNSGNGKKLLEKTNKSVISNDIQENRIVFKISKDGNTSLNNDLSSGLIMGMKNFFDFMSEIETEINNLALRLSNDFNEIQQNGIDLNGKVGQSMFSINSLQPKLIKNHDPNFKVDIIFGNENIVKQEKMIFKYVASSNVWQVSNSEGIKNYDNNNLNFPGFSLKTSGNLVDGDNFVLEPGESKAAAFSFLLKDPKSIAAASNELISSSLNNIGKAKLKIISKENIVNKSNILSIGDVFTSSNNPLLSTTFLNEGAISIIPNNVGSLNLSSISNQSSAQFNLYDNQIKGFSNININLSDGTSIALTSATEDPGDGIRSVKELADFLNSGLALDGKNHHNFRKYGLYASGGDGALTIKSSLGDNFAKVTSASILSNGNTFSASISEIEAAKSLASEIQIFTRDGRHVSGTSLNTSQIAKILKESNGFFQNAEYRNDYLNMNYRGIENKRISTGGDYIYDFGSSISYDKQATDNDGLFINKDASAISGTLTLDGALSNSSDLDGFITITSTGDDSGINFTVKGYNLDGNYQTEIIVGGNSTSVTGKKVFKSITSITSDGSAAENLKIGVKASGYNLKITNDDNVSKSITVPINSSAFYTAKKLNEDLSGTGVFAQANTKLFLGPLASETSGTFSFNLKGSNSDEVSISATVDADDLSGLARQINQFTSQTNIKAINTNDFDRLVLVSEDGYDIEMTNIVSPSDFRMALFNEEFEMITSTHTIDTSDTNENSAFIKGNVRFVSSSNFNTQIDSGQIISAKNDPSINNFYDIKYGSSGEKITVKPISMGLLDDSIGDATGKRAQVGQSTYGINVPLSSYRINAIDDDSLLTSSAPNSGALTLNGALINETSLNSYITINSSADETGNTFTIVGTNAEGQTISEIVTGGNNTSVSSAQIFKSITSITTSANAGGNLTIGTSGRQKIIDYDSLVKTGQYNTGSPLTLGGIFSTVNYLNARVRIENFEDESLNTFTITGTDLDGSSQTETIKGTNGTAVEGNLIFKTITEITVANNTTGNIRIGTVVGDESFVANIDATSIGVDTTKEISQALLNELRKESPTSTLKGKVLNKLPSENSSLDLLFEGQMFNLKMKSGEVVIDGPEENRIIANFDETSVTDPDGIAKSQGVTSAGGSFSLNGDLASNTFLGTRISFKSVEDESKNSFTITGTDLDGNSISEKVIGAENGQTAFGLKIFKSITSITSTSATSGNLEIGTAPGFKLSVSVEGTLEGDQFELVQNTTNLSNASQFGLTGATTYLASNLVKKPLISDSSENIPMRISIEKDNDFEDYNIKFLSDSSVNSLKSSTDITNTSDLLGSPSTSLLGGKITIKTASGGDRSSVKFTIVGKDMSGNSLQEVITGATGGNTVTGTKVFKTVSTVTPDATSGSGNIEVGHESQPVFFNFSKEISLLDSTSVSASTSLGTLKTHSNLGGKVKIFTNDGGNQSSTTFTVSGTDENGTSISENIVGRNGGQFSIGSKIFKSVTSITAGASVGTGNVTVDYIVQPQVSLKPPTDLTLTWDNNKSGTTDDDSLFTSKAISSASSLQFDGALSSTDADGLFTSKQITSTEKLILDGSLKDSKNLYAKLQFVFASNETGKTFTVAGYDADGIYKTDVINGASGTVNGSVEFTEILSITPSAATTGNVQIGTLAQSSLVNGSTITITSSANLTSNKFTVTGEDMFGNTIKEVITGGNNTTVYGKKVFKLINSIVPSATEANNVYIGTQATGKFSISHEIGKSNFILDRNPNNQNVYGFKTQKTRAVLNNGIIELKSLNGQPIQAKIPESATSNIVSEQIKISNLPAEELIAVVMGDGAKKISAEFDFINNNVKLEKPEYEIKVDENNKNKIEIFDKKFGHSISTRILDQNRSFEAVGSRFQFSEEVSNNDSFFILSNEKGTGDNRNVINMLDLQLDKMNEQNKGNFQEIFSNTVAKVGSNVQANDLSLKAANSNKNAAESSQSEFAGVSLDDEASHLLEFQQAYQASARILQTARELFEALIRVV